VGEGCSAERCPVFIVKNLTFVHEKFGKIHADFVAYFANICDNLIGDLVGYLYGDLVTNP
jgi:hypothetical protein